MRNAPIAVLDLVSNHMFTDEGLEQEMDQAPLGSVDYVMTQMKRELLLEQVKKEVRALWGVKSSTVDSSRCERCGVLFYYEQATSSNTCTQCGHTVFVLENELVSFHSRSRYNQNPRHVYAKKEHFFQTLVDMTCIGRRKIDLSVVRYCAAILGRGPTVTFKKVFNVLQAGGFQSSYCNKYEITARLRGRPEIVLSSRETELVRGHYNRYDACFHEFQVHYGLGNRTRSGRLRLYWPVRFVIVEMFKLIGRPELAVSVRGVAGPRRLELYKKYWKLLKPWVDRYKPISTQVYTPVLTRLHRRPVRVKYSRPRLQPHRPSSSSSSAALPSSRSSQT